MNEIVSKVEEMSRSIVGFKASYDEKIDSLISRLDKFEAGANRSAFGGGGGEGRRPNKAEAKATADYIRSRGQIQAGLTTDVDPAGGFTVYPSVADDIGQILLETSGMRAVADIVTFEQGDAFEEIFSVEAGGAVFVGENESRGETEAPDLKKLSVPAKEMYASPMVSQRLIDDSKYDIVNWLVRQVSTAFADTENTAFISGNGTLGPRGVLTYPTEAAADDTRAWKTFEHVVTGDANGFASSNPSDVMIDLMMKLKVGYRANASWMMNRSTAALLRKFKDGNGNYIWETSYQAGQPNQLLGFPVVLNEAMPDVAAGALPVLFGDFREGYRIVEKPNMRILIDPYTNKPNVIVYVYKRVGGAARNFHALKALKVSA